MRRAAATFVVALALTLVAIVAWSYWSADAASGGSGAAAAVTVNQGATPSVVLDGTSVTVSWAATTLSNGDPVAGYTVVRYDAATSAPQTILTACTGTIAATTCTEDGVPSGSWKYAVTPVIGDNWRGAESQMSATVSPLADSTPPANSIALSDAGGAAHLAGTTVYYQGSAAGSLRITNTVSDAGSGPASSATSALGGGAAGWSHTPSTVSTPAGGPYQSAPFAWASGTTSTPTVDVTGRDVAGNTSATTLTFVDDSTAPTSGTVAYADGFASGRSVSVTLTSGTDAGSGVATRRVQRSIASLSGSTCGTFGAFTDIGADSPASPYVDNGLASACYRYRYVVTDRVGNQQIATSANTAKIGYAGAVNATAGLLSHWRLGDGSTLTTTASDSFTGTAGTLLTSHAGELAASWVRQDGTADATISSEGRIYRASVGPGGYTVNTASLTPVTPDYSVEADVVLKSALAGDMVGVVGRLTSANTYYLARWQQDEKSWNLVKYVGGIRTILGSLTAQPALTVGQAHRLRLEMIGSSLKLYVDGALKVSATDTAITAAGKAGVMDGNREPQAFNPAKSNTTGLHLDGFRVSTLRALDSKGSNHGGYVNGATLGVNGALSGDTDTAAAFDGVDDHVQMTGTTGVPVGSSSRSIEAWFKTTSTARQVLFDYGSLTNTQQFGLWIDPGGTTMTAWGWGTGNDKQFTMPSAVNNGTWHQAVLTYDGTALTLYIDGVALPSQAATRSTVMNAYGFTIGAVVTPGDGNSGGYFNGSIDEVSLYSSVLSQATVTDHYQLAITGAADTVGPTGGSVDATGLVGTGSRYSTSTTISLALVKGSDPSGVASSGAELRRSTATLTDGTCGAFGTAVLVATDPSSPRSDTVADAACYRYEYAVQDTLGNATTYTSPSIKVDTTAPAAPTLAFSGFTNTYSPGSGATVYYRSAAASGSFTATASAADVSGIAAYAFPTLGSGWTATPGAAGVTTYSWNTAPAAPGTKTVTAANNAGLTSGGADFTMVDDVTPPTAGTVNYPDGTTSGTSYVVSFTTGTDDGAGVGTRLLQRASAPLTGGTCGSFTAFATVTGGTNPTSPFGETVSAGSCYQYQYVVSDHVGNQRTATSTNVVKVASSYLETISATAGLLSHWRLGESTVSSDTFAGTTGATLQSRNGEVAAGWTKLGESGTTDMVLTNAGRLRKGGTSTLGASYYSSAVPDSADYLVEADVHVASNLANDIAGVIGRASTTGSTYYAARYERASQTWILYRVLNGAWTSLGASTVQGLTAGATYRLGLDLNGSTVRLLVDGAQRVSATDAAISSAGRAGVSQGYHATATSVTDSAGLHLDNFKVSPPLADRTGSNHGDYLNGPTLGVAGAIAGDSNTAAQFDGVNDHGLVSRQIADDFSIELWFKSSQGIGTGAQWWSGAGMVDAEISGSFGDFGISLRSDGRVVAGVGPTDVSVVSSSTGLNNGAWHHVVFTRTRSSGAITLYVDGSAVGNATGSTVSLNSPTSIAFGRLLSGTNAFAGALDEIAVYNTVLDAPTIAQHYAAR